MTEHAFTHFGTDPEAFDIEGDGDGSPGIVQFANALQMWCACQDHEATVREAALAFRVPDQMILEAVEWHYWMFTTGPSDDYTKMKIEHEGE